MTSSTANSVSPHRKTRSHGTYTSSKMMVGQYLLYRTLPMSQPSSSRVSSVERPTTWMTPLASAGTANETA